MNKETRHVLFSHLYFLRFSGEKMRDLYDEFKLPARRRKFRIYIAEVGNFRITFFLISKKKELFTRHINHITCD